MNNIMKHCGGFMRLLKTMALSILLVTSATAKVKNADDFYAHKAVKLYYEPLDHRGTQWYADPLRINSPENDNLKPENFWLHVYSEGYYGFFNQYVEIDCKEPIKSHVRTADGEKISFKDSMALPNNPEQTHDTTYPFRIDRGAVEGIFSYYCL